MDAAAVMKPTFGVNNCGKRPVKRSFFGTRVCAPWQNGIYYPGIVRTMASKLAKSRSELSYIVIFEDGYCKDYLAHQIIGPGFQNISTVHLKFNQKVYITHNGREVSGHVQKHRKQTNEVFIKLNDVSETLVHRKLDDVRLLEKRKCMEHQKITSSPCSEAKRKGTHIKMDVPSAKSPKVEEEPLMDDVMAAMVLTSLSASPLGGYRSRHNSNESTASSTTSDLQLPTSPQSPPPYGDLSFSPSSSGHFSWDMNSRGTPSPVSSTSDVESGHPGSLIFGPPSVDEGIDVTDPGTHQCITDSKPIHHNKANIKTLYKCTWPGCGKTLCTVQGIEKHIRTHHLRSKEHSQVGDHEEEFYYTEIDTTVDTVSDTFANMYTSPSSPLHTPTYVTSPPGMMTPPPEQYPSSVEFRPETLCERLSPPPLQIVENNNEQQYTMVTPVLISSQKQQHEQSFSWPTVPTTQFTRFQATPQFTPSSPPHASMRHNKPSLVEQRQHQHQVASPKTNQHFVIPPKSATAGSPVHAKIRSEGKKCRKVYGMDNRDLWCTQCRWKKACVRFT